MPELPVGNVQVLLLEMQPPFVASSKTVRPDQLRHGAAALKALASEAGIPVTASAVPLGEQAPQLIEELQGIEPKVRSTVSAFGDAVLSTHLRSSGREILVLGGVSSEIAILHAALGACSAGYVVHLLLDVCGGLDPRTESAAFERMWRAGVIPSNLSSLATAMIDDMGTNMGRSIMRILDRYWGWGAHGGSNTARTASMDEREVRLLFDCLEDAWRDGDADGFARHFCDDARFIAFDGSVLTGPKEIANYHRAPFATHLAGTELQLGELKIRSIGGTVYVASEGGIVRGGRTEGELIGRSTQTFLLERVNGGLRIAVFQNTRVRPIDGPAAAEAWKKFDESWSRLRQ